jgi:formylglycine-generating enzyme required for sulfatase activity
MLIAFLSLQSTQAPQTFVQEIPESMAKITMIKLPDGKISIGGKEVEIKNLYASETEIPWEVFDVYAFRKDLTEEQVAGGVDAKSRPSKPYGKYDRGFGHNGFPAIGMAYNSALTFCEWLSKRSGLKYRLPSEAEWVYLASAGQPASTDLKEFAWFKENVDEGTRAIKTKKPNGWGFYDVLGNASEWVISPDPAVPITKGGSWQDDASFLTFGATVAYDPSWQERDAQLPKSKWWLSDGPFVGFRIVCEKP